jgi:hypothetical protein
MGRCGDGGRRRRIDYSLELRAGAEKFGSIAGEREFPRGHL